MNNIDNDNNNDTTNNVSGWLASTMCSWAYLICLRASQPHLRLVECYCCCCLVTLLFLPFSVHLSLHFCLCYLEVLIDCWHQLPFNCVTTLHCCFANATLQAISPCFGRFIGQWWYVYKSNFITFWWKRFVDFKENVIHKMDSLQACVHESLNRTLIIKKIYW
jgi:hypothetical protein